MNKKRLNMETGILVWLQKFGILVWLQNFVVLLNSGMAIPVLLA